MYKSLHVAADSNIKKINIDLRNKLSQRRTRNVSEVQRGYLQRTAYTL